MLQKAFVKFLHFPPFAAACSVRSNICKCLRVTQSAISTGPAALVHDY
ncbi:hypothetical protein BRYFOR_05878 [Marvinbryantia formatexigens DSM 14469]|uniref:Uncharacterized protein n=1 Tax=Marvinbryantia formatexigens DSM 14469 TaxID=478749 RepID=C6LB83_9FIRM|nr:hypothetical protein BRYFOR_05878 [Marvinbryantia formatexigens DSM 14469]